MGKRQGGARRHDGGSPINTARFPRGTHNNNEADASLDLASARSLLEQFGESVEEVGPALKGLIVAAKTVVSASRSSGPPLLATAGDLSSAEDKLSHAESILWV